MRPLLKMFKPETFRIRQLLTPVDSGHLFSLPTILHFAHVRVLYTFGVIVGAGP